MASPLSKNAESTRALVSWKEIAVFLNRSERTVKRWERERGLPVHRVPGGERGSVFAYPGELGDWLKGKTPELEADDPAPGNPVDGHAVDSATQRTTVPAETVPTAPPGGRQRTASPVRVAVWLAPLAFAVILMFYLSRGQADSRAAANGDPEVTHSKASYLAPDSVAVLPFSNGGGEASSDYLSDGITESLIGNLAHIPQLKVRSRDSVFRLKGKDIELKEARVANLACRPWSAVG